MPELPTPGTVTFVPDPEAGDTRIPGPDLALGMPRLVITENGVERIVDLANATIHPVPQIPQE